MYVVLKALIIAILIVPVGTALAAELTPSEQAPAPPPLPEGDVPEAVPEVRIVRTPRGVISEYRHGGRLYMVRIEPRVGAPYYLIDSNGDGQLDSRRHAVDNIQPPQWVIFSWN